MIKLTGIHKTYQSATPLHVLKGVDLHIENGELVSIMGASGSGKSTLLNIIGILDNYDEGDYSLAGTHIKNLSETRAAKLRNELMGFVFQSFNLIPQLTVAENIALPLYYQGVSEEECFKRATEYADYVGLIERLKHRPNQLSGGQQQRVAIARALATNPVVILADEPTGNLDTAMSVEIMNLFTDLHRKGKTIIMVTHEEDIAAYAEHRLVMRDGLVKEVR